MHTTIDISDLYIKIKMKIILFILSFLIYEIYCLGDQACTTPSSNIGICKSIFDCKKVNHEINDVISFKENMCINANGFNITNIKNNHEVSKYYSWLPLYMKVDGTFIFLSGKYTINNIGICCPN